METKNLEITIYRGKDLLSYFKTTLDNVYSEIEKNNYRVSKSKSDFSLDAYKWNDISYNRTKKVNKSLRRLNKTMSIKCMNITISWILKNVIKQNDLSFNVKTSLKEETIQKKRKLWLEAKTKADQLQMEYKQEKGDFYK